MKKCIRFMNEDADAVVRWIDSSERLSLLADGIAEMYPNPKTQRNDGTIKMKKYEPEESKNGFATNTESPAYITAGDMAKNAAGAVDTLKRRVIYQMREREKNIAEMAGLDPAEAKVIPAAIRCYGKSIKNKPDPELLGNAIDRAMSKVEAWPFASDNNRSLTVVPGRVIGLTVCPLPA